MADGLKISLQNSCLRFSFKSILLTNKPALLAFLSLSLIVFLLIGIPPVGSSSEAREGQVIHVLLAGENIVLPLRNGIVPSKPPLYHWLGALSAKFLNFSGEFQARFISGLAGVASLVLLYWLTLLLAQRIPGPNSRYPQVTAFLSTTILGTSYGFIRLIPDARVDLLFSALVLASIAVIARHFEAGSQGGFRRADLTLFYGVCGLAVLTKGPLGIVLPILIAMSTSAVLVGVAYTLRFFLRPHFGWAIFLLLVGPYYVGAALLSPGSGADNSFLARQVLFENLARLFGGEDIESGPLWFYVPSFLRLAFPWSLIFLYWIWQALISSRHRAQLFSWPARLGAIWFGVGFVLFSLAAGKRHSYLVPLLPGMALTVSFFLTDLYYRGGQRFQLRIERWGRNIRTFTIVLIVGLSALLLCAHFLQVRRLDRLYTIEFLVQHWQWFGIVVGLVFVLLKSAKLELRTTGFFGLYFLLVIIGLGAKAELKQFKPCAEEILRAVGNQTLVVVKEPREEHFDPIFFYLNKEVSVREIPLSEDGRSGEDRTNLRSHQFLFARKQRLKDSFADADIIVRCNQIPALMKGEDRNELWLVAIS